jgi:hypothetical protein
MQVQIELPTDFLNDIEYIKNELVNLKKNFQPREPAHFLSRNETAEMLKIDLSTLWAWTKKRELISYQLQGKVYYKRSEVESAIVKLIK